MSAGGTKVVQMPRMHALGKSCGLPHGIGSGDLDREPEDVKVRVPCGHIQYSTPAEMAESAVKLAHTLPKRHHIHPTSAETATPTFGACKTDATTRQFVFRHVRNSPRFCWHFCARRKQLFHQRRKIGRDVT